MFSVTVQPRFGDVDLLGHINNTVLAHWFEAARNPIIRIFVPDLNIKMETFSLILAHADYDFESELVFRHEVEIRSWVTHIGNKSFTVYHEAWQAGRLCVKGSAVMVHYDFKAKESTPIPEEKKRLLEMHMLEKQVVD